MALARPGSGRSWRIRKRRWLAVVALALLGYVIHFWPARRNYYGKLGGVEVRQDVPYVPGSNPKQQLDLYLPRAHVGPFPMVVFVHGGYWSPLDRRWMQPLLGAHGNVGAAFARHGIGAAVIGYRQYPEIKRGDDSLDDIAHAIGYVQRTAASFGGDPTRLFVIGHSAGGHLVSLLGMDPRILERNGVPAGAVSGFVSVDGVFDLKASLRYFKPEQAQILRQLFGPDDAALAAHSTISYARAEHPPLLFVDSTGDEPVCLNGFHEMRATLNRLGSKARFVELSGIEHNEMIIRVGMADDPLLATLLAFVESGGAG